jgi:aryl-alcohol dehydrogenase-like predicted oxidoreductase
VAEPLLAHPLDHRPLGTSGIEVSAVSLGSWLTFEHLGADEGLAVMRAARDAGIDFLDDARYDDRTGRAPIPTGYSEVVFGRLFRAAGWRRDDVVVANKLWLEFWPQESPAAELDASLGRMGFDYLDLAYCAPPPDGCEIGELVVQLGALIASGKVRAWGVLNWHPDVLSVAVGLARAEGVPPPCAAQLPYSVVTRSPVEDPATVAVLDDAGARIVASSVLAGGLLSGKYAHDPSQGRLAGRLSSPPLARTVRVADALASRAVALGVAPATLAIAFALANARVASVLFGATTPSQVAQNVAAVELSARLDSSEVDALRNLALDQGA